MHFSAWSDQRIKQLSITFFKLIYPPTQAISDLNTNLFPFLSGWLAFLIRTYCRASCCCIHWHSGPHSVMVETRKAWQVHCHPCKLWYINCLNSAEKIGVLSLLFIGWIRSSVYSLKVCMATIHLWLPF